MEQAIEELQKKQRDEAGETQDEVVNELERLKAELEEILRQLREEEETIMLAKVEARLQQILNAQLRVNDATAKLDRTEPADRDGRFSTQATQLSRDQSDIIVEVERTLRILREEGSSLVFPEALTQVRDAMRQIVRRLSTADTGQTTQLVQSLTIEQLESMLEALQQELERKEQQQANPQQQSPQEQQEQALVDALAELRLIRSLQEQVNRMTEQFDTAIAEKRAKNAIETPQQAENDQAFLDDLTRRQERIRRVTYDIATKRNR